MEIRKFLFSICYLLHCSGTSPILEPLSNGTSNIQVGGSLTSAKDCASCHESIYSSWRNSQHASSYSNILFQNGLAREQHVWCLNCHAPLHKIPQEEVHIGKNHKLDPISKEGVNCAVCHVRDGKIYGIRSILDGKDHNVYEDKKIASKQLCNSCHNFNFPRTHSPITSYNENPMQATGSEFDLSLRDIKGETCQNCHLPKSHVLGGVNDRKFFAKNFDFSINSIMNGEKHEITFALEFKKIGHHFPTGDLFRAMTLELIDSSGKTLAIHTIHKKVRVIDAFVVEDTRLKLKPFEKGIKEKITLASQKKPEVCKIIFHYQNPIEKEIEGKIPDELYRWEIYKGICSVSN